MTVLTLEKCSRCKNGQMYYDEDERVLVCLQCGKREYDDKPLEPRYGIKSNNTRKDG